MAVRPVKPDIRKPPQPIKHEEEADKSGFIPPPTTQELQELIRLLKSRSQLTEEKPIPQKPQRQLDYGPPQPEPEHRPKIPISWIIFNRRPFNDRRLRMARLVGFMVAGTICLTIGQNLAGGYYTAARLTGTFGTFIYSSQVGTILLILGLILVWEGIKS